MRPYDKWGQFLLLLLLLIMRSPLSALVQASCCVPDTIAIADTARDDVVLDFRCRSIPGTWI